MAGMSGIVALFFSGICHSHYTYYSASISAQVTPWALWVLSAGCAVKAWEWRHAACSMLLVWWWLPCTVDAPHPYHPPAPLPPHHMQ